MPYNPDADKKLPKQEGRQAEYFERLFALNSPICQRPLEQIGYDQISAFKANIQNRKVSRYKPYTIRDACKHVENLLGWLEEAGRWHGQFNYTKLLKVRTARLYTPLESKLAAKGTGL